MLGTSSKCVMITLWNKEHVAKSWVPVWTPYHQKLFRICLFWHMTDVLQNRLYQMVGTVWLALLWDYWTVNMTLWASKGRLTLNTDSHTISNVCHSPMTEYKSSRLVLKGPVTHQLHHRQIHSYSKLYRALLVHILIHTNCNY